MYGRGHGTGERKQRKPRKTSRKQLLADIAHAIQENQANGAGLSFDEYFERYGISDDKEKLIILAMVEED